MTRKWLTTRFAIGCGLGTAAALAPRVFPQQAELPVRLEIRSLSGDTERSPQYDDVSGRFLYDDGGGRDDWYVVRTEYTTRTDWIDELTFTYYVLFRPDRDDAGALMGPSSQFLILKGSVTYIHVPDGRHESLMFVHPRLLERFGVVERMAVLVTTPASAEPLGFASEPPARTPWWQQAPAIEGLLMHRDQSPYGPVLADDHEMIRPAGGGSR